MITGLLLPFLLFVAAIVALVLIFIWAPAGAVEAAKGEYATFVKVIAASIGPAAAAFLGDLASEATRPNFTPETPPRVIAAYRVSRIASLCLFGVMGGAGAAALGISPFWAYLGAAGGGHVGVQIINVIVNRTLDKYLPPKGGAS